MNRRTARKAQITPTATSRSADVVSVFHVRLPMAESVTRTRSMTWPRRRAQNVNPRQMSPNPSVSVPRIANWICPADDVERRPHSEEVPRDASGAVVAQLLVKRGGASGDMMRAAPMPRNGSNAFAFGPKSNQPPFSAPITPPAMA